MQKKYKILFTTMVGIIIVLCVIGFVKSIAGGAFSVSIGGGLLMVLGLLFVVLLSIDGLKKLWRHE